MNFGQGVAAVTYSRVRESRADLWDRHLDAGPYENGTMPEIRVRHPGCRAVPGPRLDAGTTGPEWRLVGSPDSGLLRTPEYDAPPLAAHQTWASCSGSGGGICTTSNLPNSLHPSTPPTQEFPRQGVALVSAGVGNVGWRWPKSCRLLIVKCRWRSDSDYTCDSTLSLRVGRWTSPGNLCI
jgi:hypothetical protein